MTTVAFIGLGNMGSGMADNLVKANFDVLAFDLSDVAMQMAKDNGCRLATSASDAVSQAEVVVTMLPAGKHVDMVYHNDVLPHAKSGTVLVDCSTIDVATSKKVANSALEQGFEMVDAPVSGGTKAAAEGTLTFMVGGSTAGFEKAQGVLQAMGRKIVHAGEHGAGQAAKICNNMLLGATMVATCETFQLAQKLGLDPQVFFDISSNASGQNWSMTSYCPVKGVGPQSPADSDYTGGFASPLMLKDLTLAMMSAKDVDADVPMGEKAQELYEKWCEGEGSTMDFSSIIKML